MLGITECFWWCRWVPQRWVSEKLYNLVSQLTADLKTRKSLVVGGVAMFSAAVNALLHAVLDESYVDVPAHEAGENALMASEALESAPKSELDTDNLSAVGRRAVLPAPSMWN